MDTTSGLRMPGHKGRDAARGQVHYHCARRGIILEADPVNATAMAAARGLLQERDFPGDYDCRIGMRHDIRNSGKAAANGRSPCGP